jgi:hypothetical protein
MMSPELTRKFINIIKNYRYHYRYIPHNILDRVSWNSLCCAIFRSVLTPYVYKYNDEIVSDYFTLDLVLQTLDSVPGLRTLQFVLRREDDPAAIV